MKNWVIDELEIAKNNNKLDENAIGYIIVMLMEVGVNAHMNITIMLRPGSFSQWIII